MIIQHKEEGNRGAFYIEENGDELAEMVYSKHKDRIIIEHTEVDESLQGKNIGFQLVEHGVELARQENMKVQATCTFAKKILDRHEQFHDVLYVS